MCIRLYLACARSGREMLSIKMEDNARHVKGMLKKSSRTSSSSMSTRMGKFYMYTCVHLEYVLPSTPRCSTFDKWTQSKERMWVGTFWVRWNRGEAIEEEVGNFFNTKMLNIWNGREWDQRGHYSTSPLQANDPQELSARISGSDMGLCM